MSEGWDSGTKETVRKIPLLTVRQQDMLGLPALVFRQPCLPAALSCSPVFDIPLVFADQSWSQGERRLGEAAERGQQHHLRSLLVKGFLLS